MYNSVRNCLSTVRSQHLLCVGLVYLDLNSGYRGSNQLDIVRHIAGGCDAFCGGRYRCGLVVCFWFSHCVVSILFSPLQASVERTTHTPPTHSGTSHYRRHHTPLAMRHTICSWLLPLYPGIGLRYAKPTRSRCWDLTVDTQLHTIIYIPFYSSIGQNLMMASIGRNM